MVDKKRGIFARLNDRLNPFSEAQLTAKFMDMLDSVETDNQPRFTVNLTDKGSTGSYNYSGYPAEEYLNTLRGRNRAEVYDQMRRSDHQIHMCLTAVKSPILSATWEIQPGDPDDPQAMQDKELVEHILFHDMEHSWKHKLREILTFLDFGHSVFEITDKIVVGHKKFGTFNGIRSLGWRSPRTIERWNLNPEDGTLKSVSQYAFGDLQKFVDIPAEYLLVFSHQMEGSNYEGISALRHCYGPWLRKDNYLKLNAIGIERFAIPTPIAEVPDIALNNEQYNNLIASLNAYATNTANYLTYPKGWLVDLKTNTYDPSKVEASIDAEDRRISKAFLTNFLELGMGSSGGAYALSNDLSDFMLGSLVHIASMIEDVINQQLIPRIIQLNYGPREVYPKLAASGIDERAGKDLAMALKNLVDSAIIIPDDPMEEQIRKRFKLSPPSKDGQRMPKAAAAPTDSQGIPSQDDVSQDDQSQLSLSERIQLVNQIRRTKHV